MIKVYFFLSFLVIFNSIMGISIYPKELKKDITRGASEIFSITNDSNEKKLYKVLINMDEKKINIKILPKIFILNPNEKKEVKVFLKTDSNLISNGIYSGTLSIEVVPMKLDEYNNLKFNIHMDILTYINKNK
ncbi:MAG: hypothetical protein ACRCZO_13925 [Cetobacterium sp.]